MGPTLVTIEGIEKYQYELPEGKTYYIPKAEFDAVTAIYDNWETILSESDLTKKQKEDLTNISGIVNSKRVPPVDTKICSKLIDGEHYAVLEFPEMEASIRERIDIRLTHHFLIQEFVNENNQQVIFFGALEKQKNKTAYMMHQPAHIRFKKGQPWFPKRLKNNEVYLYQTDNGYYITAKNNAGELVCKNQFFSKQDKDSITPSLLKNGVLPDSISSRVKLLFPAPQFGIEPLVRKTEHETEELHLIDGYILHTSRSDTYHLLKKEKRQTYKRATLMYLGQDLDQYLYSDCAVHIGEPPKAEPIPPNTMYVYQYENRVVYQTCATNGEKIFVNGIHIKEKIKFSPKEKKALVDAAVKLQHLEISISLSERAKIAQECCDMIRDYHKNDFLVVDIKPSNFVCGSHPKYPSKTTFIIDYESIIQKGKPIRVWTDRYVAPELTKVVSYGDAFQSAKQKITIKPDARPSVASDIYSMGITLDEIFKNKHDDLIKKIITEMTHTKPEWRLSLDAVSNLLTIYSFNQQYKLTAFALECIQLFEKTAENQSRSFCSSNDANHKQYQRKLEILGSLIQNLATIKLDRPLTYFEQQTFLQLIDMRPNHTNWNTPENIKKLLAPETGPILTCTLLDSLEYLEKNQSSLFKAKKKVNDLVANLFTIVLNDEAVKSAISTAEEGSRASKTHSWAETNFRYQQIQQALKSGNNTVPVEHQAFIYKMNKLFPEYWKDKEVIQHICSQESSLIREILSKAIEYMETTKNGGHSRGRKAVRCFVKKLIEMKKKFLETSEMNKTVFEGNIESEKEKFLKERVAEYRCGLFGLPSGASIHIHHPSTRRRIFTSTTTRT